MTLHPICRHYTPCDRVQRDGSGVSRRIGCSASCSEPGGYFGVVWLRLMLPLGCVGRECPRLGLLWEVVHPIRRHYTPSDRVYRDGSGAALRNKRSAYRVQCSPYPCARAGATCVNGAAGLRRRKTNRGGAQALRLGPLLMSYQHGDTSA